MLLRKLIIIAALAAVALAAGVYAAGRAKRFTQSMSCGNYMCSICFAARTWASENNGKMPTDFLSMSNELATPRVLICDADRSRRAPPNWATFTPDLSSYEIVGVSLQDGDTNGIFLRCRIHKDHIGYADGTVFDGIRRRIKFP
jgi:hypothetical protein